jgi:hypothetical protein
MVKDTGGYVFTYEVSFFGYYKEVNLYSELRTQRFLFLSMKSTIRSWERLWWVQFIGPTWKSIKRRKPSRKVYI